MGLTSEADTQSRPRGRWWHVMGHSGRRWPTAPGPQPHVGRSSCGNDWGGLAISVLPKERVGYLVEEEAGGGVELSRGEGIRKGGV